ncbi:MAG: hypothetical protein H6912_08135 [Kordiimonadaceae bacterium]|nr:hypothetical protein [Kordiimonadaceae bacterium]
MIKKFFIFLCLMFPSFGNAQVLNLEQYLAYLQKAQTEEISPTNMDDFYKTSRAFWMANKVDYNNHPAEYKVAMDLYHDGQDRFVRDRSIKIDRFESTIENFRRFDVRNTLPKSPILFVGSSSIVFWQTANSFPEYPVTNRGFGGASLPEVIHYYDDVIKRHNPSMMVVYCDIDVENGKSPEFSVNAFKELVSRVEQDFKNIPILMLSMKPTLVDDLLGREVRKNKMITNQKLMEFSNSQDNLYYVDITSPMMRADGSLKPEIFLDDGMHLNSKGYDLWDPILRKEIKQIRGN